MQDAAPGTIMSLSRLRPVVATTGGWHAQEPGNRRQPTGGTVSFVTSPGNLAAALTELWSPRVVAEVDDAYVKVAKVRGSLAWHSHDDEDELFFVLKGHLRIEMEGRTVELREGEMCVVPKGVRHNPVAEQECQLMLVERRSTLHTGTTPTARTRSLADQLRPIFGTGPGAGVPTDASRPPSNVVERGRQTDAGPTNRARHVGIVGVSAEGAALCYRTICVESAEVLGPHNHPQVTMHTYPLAEYMEHVRAGRWHEAGRLLLSSADVLVRAGAELLICPDNTLHQALDLVRDRTPIPWMHIVEEVAEVAQVRNFKRLGVLGTRYLMEGPVYRERLLARGIGHEIPDAGDRGRINEIIFDELVYGRLEERSKSYFRAVIEALGARGCDAVVLGCTEIPLLVAEADSPLPAIDSTRTLARAAIRAATR
jgi:aspartate racemase